MKTSGLTVVLPDPPTPSHALTRIRRALLTYAPRNTRILLPSDPDAAIADLWILIVIGRRDRVARDVAAYRAAGARVALVQVVWRSSLAPTAEDWAPVWAQSHVVWSPYRLPTEALYHAPFGVDTVFAVGTDPAPAQPWLVLTSGAGWLQESVREVTRAARRAGGVALHLGPSIGHETVRVSGLPDGDLARLYSATRFVSGLRRTEGFELPCAEGLACGARPILFAQPHYTDWYGDLAAYVAEQDRPHVENAVLAILKQPRPAVTEAERREAVRRFDWRRLAAGFWERCL